MTKFLQAAIGGLLLDKAAAASFLETNDIPVTKFLTQDDYVTID